MLWFSAGLMYSSGGISHLVNSHTMPHLFLQIFRNESCMNLPSLTIPAIRPNLWTVLLIQEAGSWIPATAHFVSNRVTLLLSDPRIPQRNACFSAAILLEHITYCSLWTRLMTYHFKGCFLSPQEYRYTEATSTDITILSFYYLREKSLQLIVGLEDTSLFWMISLCLENVPAGTGFLAIKQASAFPLC